VSFVLPDLTPPAKREMQKVEIPKWRYVDHDARAIFHQVNAEGA
jgi:hypothetical protein